VASVRLAMQLRSKIFFQSREVSSLMLYRFEETVERDSSDGEPNHFTSKQDRFSKMVRSFFPIQAIKSLESLYFDQDDRRWPIVS
jgi:hypothetical protein